MSESDTVNKIYPGIKNAIIFTGIGILIFFHEINKTKSPIVES
jgi:hypothetical protein